MPRFVHVMVAAGDATERATLEGMLTEADHGCLLVDDVAQVMPLARAHRPDVLLLSGTLGEGELDELIGELKGDPDTAHIPVMLLTAESSATLRRRCVELAIEELVEGPLDSAIILARLPPLARLSTLQAEMHMRFATARAFGVDAAMPEIQEDAGGYRVLVVGSAGAMIEAIPTALAGDLTIEFEADAYRAGDALERTRYDAAVVVVDGSGDRERSLDLASRIRNNPSLFNLPVLMVHGADVLEQPMDAYRAGASIALAQPVDHDLLRTSLLLLMKRQRRRWNLRGALDLTLTDETRDPDSSVYSTEFLRAHLERLVAAAQERGKTLTAAVYSILNREAVARDHGAEAGARLIAKAADWIGGMVRAEDLTARLGDTEICTVLPDTPADNARIVVDRVSAVIRHSEFALGEEVMAPIRIEMVSTSATLESADTVDSLIERAQTQTL